MCSVLWYGVCSQNIILESSRNVSESTPRYVNLRAYSVFLRVEEGGVSNICWSNYLVLMFWWMIQQWIYEIECVCVWWEGYSMSIDMIHYLCYRLLAWWIYMIEYVRVCASILRILVAQTNVSYIYIFSLYAKFVNVKDRICLCQRVFWLVRNSHEIFVILDIMTVNLQD